MKPVVIPSTGYEEASYLVGHGCNREKVLSTEFIFGKTCSRNLISLTVDNLT
jgi:hypothetical protein